MTPMTKPETFHLSRSNSAIKPRATETIGPTVQMGGFPSGTDKLAAGQAPNHSKAAHIGPDAAISYALRYRRLR